MTIAGRRPAPRCHALPANYRVVKQRRRRLLERLRRWLAGLPLLDLGGLP
jgi:hypothetical protein